MPPHLQRHMAAFFAPFAELELNLISERTCEGLNKAGSSGMKLGRPKRPLGFSRLNGREDEIPYFLRLGVSRPTLYHFIDSRGLRPNP